jgi:hypothetical protein
MEHHERSLHDGVLWTKTDASQKIKKFKKIFLIEIFYFPPCPGDEAHMRDDFPKIIRFPYFKKLKTSRRSYQLTANAKTPSCLSGIFQI